MRKLSLLIALLTTLGINNSHATTWNEPWADRVIKESSSFILAKVIATDPEKGISIEILRTLGGKELKGQLLISDFYLLQLCSSSGGHGAEFHTKEIDSCFFFISQNKEGKYCIATPTTGFDYVLDAEVVATYRHSYHQAGVPLDIYEKTMTAVFNNYHHLPYDTAYMRNFVNDILSKAPAGFGKDEVKIFFLQHVALECVHHLKLDIKESLVLPFLNDKTNFHNQVSGARAMVAFNSNISKQELLRIISDTSRRVFVKVMCIQSLAEFGPKELKTELVKMEKTASDEGDGFGGNIMDPRVCTSIRSVKWALNDLINRL